MDISLIVATAHNNAIGRGNELPWHLPQDLKYFKSVTLGKPVIMGRKTFESIGKPLPGRTNIVVTRQQDWHFAGVLVAHDLVTAIELAKEANSSSEHPKNELMIIGGAEIYKHALPLADRIYQTKIDITVEHADAFFPEIDLVDWQLVSSVDGNKDASLVHQFLTYQQKSKLLR